MWCRLAGAGDIYELDESLAEDAITEGAFSFLKQAVVGSPRFHQEVGFQQCLCMIKKRLKLSYIFAVTFMFCFVLQKFYVTQLHNLITDFIVQMPLKVTTFSVTFL